MGTKSFLTLGMLIGLIVGLTCGFLIGSSTNAGTIEELKHQLDETNSELNTLSTKYEELQDENSQLNNKIKSLISKYNLALTEADYWESQYRNLKDKYDSLLGSYSDVEDAVDLWIELSNVVIYLNNTLREYTFIPDAFKRTLNYSQISRVSSTVSSVTHNTKDFWNAIQRIYNYLATNIDIAYDIDFPYIDNFNYKIYNGQKALINFTIYTYRNYVQTPEFTLEFKHGDCDDIAVLTYAMIKNYMIDIYGEEYDLYIVYFTVGDSAHLTVFIPAEGGNLCIVDPAMKYLTKSWGSISSKPAEIELKAYSQYFAREGYGEIDHITIWRVDVEDGSYTQLFDGNMEEAIKFLSS